jgi:hypothetical protein
MKALRAGEGRSEKWIRNNQRAQHYGSIEIGKASGGTSIERKELHIQQSGGLPVVAFSPRDQALAPGVKQFMEV